MRSRPEVGVHSLGWVIAREGETLMDFVDFDDHLRRFYYDACGSWPTHGGLIGVQR